MEIKPQEAARKLMANIHLINNATNAVMEARTDFAMAEAAYMDAKAEATIKRLGEGISVTAAQVWIAVDTKDDKKKVLMAECKLKNLQDQLNVYETGNNNYKAAIKIMEMEAKNLGLT